MARPLSRLAVMAPALLFAVLVALFALRLGGDRNPQELKSVLIGRPAPGFTVPALTGGNGPLSHTDLSTGGPLLVNFFASWCLPCRAEHDNLMRLARDEGIPIIGIAYKDKPRAARAFLADLGNPFIRTGLDESGRVGIEWGVTGVPETFLIDGEGIVRYRHFGPIVGDSLNTRLLPQIAALGGPGPSASDTQTANGEAAS